MTDVIVAGSSGGITSTTSEAGMITTGIIIMMITDAVTLTREEEVEAATDGTAEGEEAEETDSSTGRGKLVSFSICKL